MQCILNKVNDADLRKILKFGQILKLNRKKFKSFKTILRNFKKFEEKFRKI